MMVVHLPADQWTSHYSADWLETLTTEEGEGGRGVGGYGVGVNAPRLDTIQSHDGGSPACRPTDICLADWLETLTTEEDGGRGGVRGGWGEGGGLTSLVWMKVKACLLPGFLNVLATCRSMYAEIAVRVVKLYRHAMTVVRATTMR